LWALAQPAVVRKPDDGRALKVSFGWLFY